MVADQIIRPEKEINLSSDEGLITHGTGAMQHQKNIVAVIVDFGKKRFGDAIFDREGMKMEVAGGFPPLRGGSFEVDQI